MCPQRPEALGNRRVGTTTGEWSAHKLPRRLDWPRWEGPEQGSRNCVGGAAERTPPAARPASREAVASRTPSFGKRKGKSLGFRKNRSLEPTTLAQNSPAPGHRELSHQSPARYPERGRPP